MYISPSTTPSNPKADLEDLGHLTQKVCLLWGTAELDAFLSHLIMDSRDGERQGLPVKVAAELLFLARLNKTLRAQDIAVKLSIKFDEAFQMVDQGDHARLKLDAFNDPASSRETRSRPAGPTPRSPTGRPPSGSQLSGFFALIMLLVKSKWVLALIVLVLGAKVVWPTVKTVLGLA